MASGLLIKQKQLLAGNGIAINHGETASTISLAENALDNSVRIYDATVESSTGVVTITDGTPVTDLRIGDEIRTPDGVYQKTKDSITTGSPADGTRIKVSGITSPAEANGLYILTETEKVWKHESADYWISQWSGSYWLIANTSSPSNPGISIFYASGSSSSMPWEMSNWSAMSGSGSPVLENASTEQTITDTLALFEYASLADDVTRLGNAVNQAGGLLQIDLETNAIPEEYLDTSRLLPDTAEVSSDSAGNPVIFKAVSRIDNTYWLCLPLNEDTNDRSTYGINTETYGTVNIVSNAPSSPGGSAFFNGSSCLHGTLPAQFGTADFTVRFWMMAPEISGSSYPSTIFSTRQGELTSGDAVALHGTENGKLFIYSNTYITSNTDVPSVLKAGTWHHIAIVRKSGVATLYVDGNVYVSGSLTNSLTRQPFSLGALWDGSNCTAAGTFYMASLDVLNYAAYDGAFTVPSYQPGILTGMGYVVATDNELKGMLSVAGIDESRLLPENPENGDIPMFNATATTGGGNDETVKLLIQPSTSGNQIVDSAAGNAAPATVNQGNSTYQVTVDESGELVFPGNGSYLSIPAVNVNTTITGDSEFCIDITMTPGWESGTRKILNLGVSSWYGYLNPAYGTFWFFGKGYDNIPMGLMHNVTHILTIEQWNDDGQWKISLYTDGAIKQTFNGQIGIATSDMRFGIGDNAEGGGFLGTMNNIRLRNVAPYHGVSFQPDETPYTIPQVVGDWENQNLNGKIDAKIATHNTSLDAHPMHNTAEADFNNITESGFYNQYNQSSVNAPLNFDIGYFLIVSKYEDSTNTKLVQIALPRLEDAIQWIYTRYAVSDSADGALEWTKWSCTKGAAHYLTETDFNTVVDSGNYLISQGSAGSPNSPTNTTYLLNVTAYTEVGLARIFQTATKYATGTSVQEIYTRVGVRETAGGAVVWNDWLRLSNAPTVISNPDYNQVTATGTYYMSTGSGSQNAPDQSSYMLTVLSYKETSWERIFQTAVRYVTNTQSDKQAIFTRVGDRATAGGEITWTKWSAISSSESIGTATNDYNALTTPGDYYLSFGQNISNLNAPANGPFHVLVHRYQNAAGTAKPILQIAASQIVSEEQTPTMFFRSASYADSAWTFQPWLRLLTEKDVTYNTGAAAGAVTKNDYIKIGNAIVYIGSINLRLNSGTSLTLPVLSNNMTFVASCNTYVGTITKLDIFLDSGNKLNIDIGGTKSESAANDQVNVGWIGIGYLS